MKRIKYKRIPKYAGGGNMNSNTGDAVMSAIPGYGMFHGAAKSLSNVGQGMMSTDEYGNTFTDSGQMGKDIMKNSISSAGDFAAKGDNMGAIREVLGGGKIFRTLGTIAGGDDAQTGFWKSYNRLSGRTSLDKDAQGRIDAVGAEKQRLADEAAAEKARQDEIMKKQQDIYNKGYYAINDTRGIAGGSIYANGGIIPPSRNPIIVSSKNDPRLLAYNDSLDSFKWGLKDKEKTLRRGTSPKGDDINLSAPRHTISPKEYIDEKYKKLLELGINVSKKDIEEDTANTDPVNKGTNKKNRAISYDVFPFKTKEGSYKSANYAKPVQPVILKEEVETDYLSSKSVNIERDMNLRTSKQEDKMRFPETTTEIKTTPSYRIKYTKDRTGKVLNEEYFDFDNNPIKKMGGGGLLPLATDIVKAEGPTHEQGGIQLQANGKHIAEVEGEEVIQNNRVFSDRLKVGKKTYAELAEKLGKKKGKFELMSTSGDFRDKNTSERMLSNIELDLDNLFMTQQASKSPEERAAESQKMAGGGYLDAMEESDPSNSFNTMLAADEYYGRGNAYHRDQAKRNRPGYLAPMDEGEDPSISYMNMLAERKTSPSTSTGGTDSTERTSNFDYAGTAKNVLGMAVPFIDNIYNAKMINKTPEIPKPLSREILDMKAVPLKTRVDVGNQLANVNDMYRDFRLNTDQNTANSSVGRANKINAFAKTIKAKNNIYDVKNMTETDLINKNQMNLQGVDNANTRNRQDITNQNLALTDAYNMNKVLREDNILKAKSQNVANATEDAMNLIQDNRMKNLDQERIMTDSLKYNDASGYARLIGTPTMNNLMKNPQYKAQVEKALKDSGQTKAYNEFKKKYK